MTHPKPTHANPIAAERHPKRYESHKYWGRKPANIVRRYLEHYSGPGQLVLDPFCGSGVTLLEALALDRHAVGYDLNPAACFIAETLAANPVDLPALHRAGHEILRQIEPAFPYYKVHCSCGRPAELINAVWRAETYLAKYYRCPHCGPRLAETTPFDQAQAAEVQLPAGLWYPTDPLPANADAERIDQLFTPRNLLALSLLFDRISQLPQDDLRRLLLYTFTANLAFTTRLIPVNEKRFRQGRNCTGVWGFKRFWLPPFHVENNVFNYFRNRLDRTIAAKHETAHLLGPSQASLRLLNRSSTRMPELADNTIDFIFTDPPFGDMIPYLNLSTLWNAWLQRELPAAAQILRPDPSALPQLHPDQEIILDHRRDQAGYARKLAAVFAECHRVLKTGRFLAVAFNNKSMQIWRILLDAIHQAGFTLRECQPAADGELSFTQTTRSARGSLRGHFVYLFQKTSPVLPPAAPAPPVGQTVNLPLPPLTEALAHLETELLHFLAGPPRTTTDIYNHLIPHLVNHNLLHPHLPPDAIERLLTRHADLIEHRQPKWIEGELVELKSYSWQPRDEPPKS